MPRTTGRYVSSTTQGETVRAFVPAELPALVNIALVHAQFETIHPFQDGNARLGRLLITALLEHWGLLREPLLYLSGYLKRHQGRIPPSAVGHPHRGSLGSLAGHLP